MFQQTMVLEASDRQLHLVHALIVGGAPEARRDLSQQLAAEAVECCEAADGIDALRFCGDTSIDLIIMNEELDRMPASELASLVRRGAFGAPPPPIICWRTEGEDLPGDMHWDCVAQVRSPVDEGALNRALAVAFPLA